MRINCFILELSCIFGATCSSGSIRSRPAEFYVYTLPGIIPSAISHSRRVDHANLLVDRPRAACSPQLRDPGLANFTTGCFRTHRDHCVVYLVRERIQ